MEAKMRFWVYFSMLFLLLVAIVGCGGGGGGTSVPATPSSTLGSSKAAFTSSVTAGVAPLTVDFTFTGNKSVEDDFHWDFGDNLDDENISNDQNSRHIFKTPGTYQVKLTLGSSIANVVIVVNAAPVDLDPPVASFNVNATTGVAPLALTFTDTSTGSPTSWLWNFGDGSTATTQNAMHTYQTAGTYTASLSASNAGGTKSESVTITVTAPPVIPPVVPPTGIKAVGFKAVPEAEYTEAITLALNDDFLAAYPTLTQTAKAFFEGYINSVFAKNTDKRYVVGQIVTYAKAEVPTMSGQGKFYLDNNFSSGAGGTTVFVYAYANFADVPSQFIANGPNGPVGASVNYKTVGGKLYNELWMVEEAASACLRGKAVADAAHGAGSFEAVAATYLHELGHTNGLAWDEWYRYVFQDLTGALPKLPDHDRATQYPSEPMVLLWTPGVVSEFSLINANMINLNANHQYKGDEILKATPANIYIKVLNADASPAVGATVKTFGKTVSDANMTMSSPMETLTTGADGKVQIKSDDWATYVAKAIKVSSGGKYAGRYVTLTDLQEAYLLVGLDGLRYNENVTFTIVLP